MPYIKLPDGSYYQVDEGTDYMSALTQAQQKYPTAFGGAPAAKPTSGIMSALGAGFKGGLGEAAENVGAFTGIAGLQKFGQKQQEKAAASYAPTSDKDIEKASDQGLLSELGARAKQFLEPYAQSAGSIAGRFGAPIAAGAAAGAGLALAAPELAATAVGGAGLEAMGLGTVGALTGAGATALADAPIEIGQKELERKRAGLPPDPLRSTAYGLAATAINTISGHLLSGPIQGIIGKTAAQEAKLLAPKVLAGDLTATEASAQLSGTLRNILQGTAENAATGTAMMLGNTALSRASVGQDLTSPEARAQYGEDIKGALTLAPMFGLAHGLGARGAAQKGLEAEAARGLQAREEAEKLQSDLEAKQQQDVQGPRVQQDLFTGQEMPTDETRAGPQAALRARIADLKAQAAATTDADQLRILQKQQQTAEAELAKTPATEAPTEPVDYHRQALLLKQRMEDLQTQAAATTDPTQMLALANQHAQAEAALQEATTLAGKQPKPLDVQLAEATAKMNKAKENGEIQEAAKQAQKILDLQQQGAQANTLPMQKFKATLTPMDESLKKTTLLAEPKPAAAREAATARLGDVENQEADLLGQSRADDLQRQQAADAERAAVAQEIQTKKSFAAGPQGELPGFETTSEQRKATEAAAPKPADSIDYQNQARTLYAYREALDNAAKSTLDPKAKEDLIAKRNEASKALKEAASALDASLGEKLGQESSKPDTRQLDIFKKDDFGQTPTADERKAEKDRFEASLQDRLDLAGSKVTRDVTPEEYDAHNDEIERLKSSINTIQGNAKSSIYDRMVELAKRHEELKARAESGLATPSPAERVAAGRGQKVEPRPMTAQERGYLKRSMDAVVKEYNGLLNKHIEPAVKRIEELEALKSKVKVEPAAKASDIRAEQEAERDRLARQPKSMSLAAKTAKRINAGDVALEAKKSSKMREVARVMGREEPEYAAFLTERKKELQKLTKKYGSDSAEVAKFRSNIGAEMAKKAEELGEKTPEYKATLEKYTEAYRESVLSAGKQEIKSKRGVQETRRVGANDEPFTTSSPESLARSKEKNRKLEERVQRPIKGDMGDELEAHEPVLYRSPDADKPSSLKPGEVQLLADRITKDWKNAPDIQVHADETTLPQKIIDQAKKDGMTGKITGVYDPDTKVVHLVEQNLKTAQDVGLTIAHEAAGHFGLRETMGKRLNDTMDALYKGNEAVRRAADEKIAKGVEPRIAVEEVLAEMAETGPKSPAERSALRRIYDAVKGFLQDMAPRVFGNRVISDEAVRGIVANARNYVIEGGKAGKGKAETPIALYRNKVAPELKGAMDVANAVIATEKPLSERITKDAFGRGSLEFMTKMVDQFAPLVRVSRLMDAKAGTQMMYFLRMTGQRNNLLGQVVGHGALERVEKTRADGKKEYLYETKEGGPTLVGVNKALVDANKLTGSPDATAALFSLDNVAKRAKSVGLDKLNYENLTQAKLDAAIKEIDAVPGLRAIFDKAHAEYQKFNEGNINFAVQAGYLSKDLAAKMRANKDYVPYYRENGKGEISLMMGNEEITKVGNIKNQPYLHELVGGNQRILDFNTAAVRNAGMLLDMGLRNQAAKAAAYGLKSVGMAEVRDGKAALGPNVFNFKVDGEDKHAIVQTANDIPAELLVKGMEGIPVQTSSLLHMMGMPSRLVRQMFVANPVSAARILFKDTISSALVAGSDLTTLGESLKNVKDGLMARRGLAGGEVFQGMPADMANILREVQSGKPGWETLLAKAHVLHAKADAMTRQIRYDSYIKQGLSEMEASYMALESMNFTRRGISPSIHVLNTLNPFINSQIQGINTLVQSIRGTMPLNEKLKIRDKVLQRGMLLASSSMLYAALMQDDETYKNSTPEQKYNNFFVPFPGIEEKVRVPIPFEAGMLFKSIPEALVNAMYGKDADAASGMRQVVQKMIPGGDTLGIPLALRPAIEAGIGKSFYTGRDIESKHEQSMQPGTRTRDSTSAFADALGNELNVSPVKIDHLIQGYTGGLGLTLMNVASSLVFGKDRGPAPAESLTSQLPIIGSTFQPKDAGAIVDEAYSVMQEASRVKASYNDLITRGRPDAAAAYLAKNAEEFNKATMSQQFTSTMGQFQKQLQAIMISGATPEEKRVAIDNLKAQRTAYAEQTLKAVEKTTPQ